MFRSLLIVALAAPLLCLAGKCNLEEDNDIMECINFMVEFDGMPTEEALNANPVNNKITHLTILVGLVGEVFSSLFNAFLQTDPRKIKILWESVLELSL